MKAMILAAGLGTRLRPLTDDRPKALVKINGRTLLELALTRLRSFGVREAIVNVHHFADMIVEYLKANDNFGMSVAISREETLLDTGGGLKKAAYFFVGDSGGGSSKSAEPFFVHNVDVVSEIDLGRMARVHGETRALATLAVQERKTTRYLLFNAQGELCGRRFGSEGKPELVRPAPQWQALAFCGIHVISPRLFAMMSAEGAFSIITSYLRLAAEGEKILAFRAEEYYWRDLGRADDLAQAARDLE